MVIVIYIFSSDAPLLNSLVWLKAKTPSLNSCTTALGTVLRHTAFVKRCATNVKTYITITITSHHPIQEAPTFQGRGGLLALV